MQNRETDIGVLIALFFQQFMEAYGDEDLASVATAAAINDLLLLEATRSRNGAAA